MQIKMKGSDGIDGADGPEVSSYRLNTRSFFRYMMLIDPTLRMFHLIRRHLFLG